jgi:ATP-dependent Clp protease ATP-binding subunit ClpC
LQIQELLNREGFIRRTTLINISPQALHWVAQRGYDSRMGGRALKRQIERDLTALSAEQLVKTNLETPIIFDIYLDNDKLVPRIKPLTFAQPLNDEWLPLLPSEANGRKGFGLLKKEIEQILNLLDDENEVESAEWDWLFYRLKDQASEMKTKLQN